MKHINAYAAGLFDGEGCIIINKRKRESGSYYYLQMNLSMTNERTIQFMHFCYGGKIYSGDRKPGIWKPQWHWCLNSTEAYNFLTVIRPYTVTKIEEVDVAIEFYEHTKPSYHNSKYQDRSAIEQYGEHTKNLLSALKKQ